MLDVQFGQASDPGKVRTNNEDAMGSFIPCFAPSGPIPRLSVRGCGRSGRHGSGRGRLVYGHLGADRGVCQGPGRHHAHQPAAAPDPARQCRGPRLHPRAGVPRQEDGHHAGGLRPALRSGHRLARRRLALLPGPQRPGQADHAGPYLGKRAAKDGADLRRAKWQTPTRATC